MPEDNSGGKPRIACIQCGTYEGPQEPLYLTAWGLGWEHLCTHCRKDYVDHIMACLVNAVPGKPY